MNLDVKINLSLFEVNVALFVVDADTTLDILQYMYVENNDLK